MKCTNSAKSRMDANMQLTINSFRPLLPDKIFSPTLPGLLVKSLTFHWQLSNSLTLPGLPDKSSTCLLHNTQRLSVYCTPRHQLSSYGRRAFCVAGPSVWNSLPDNLRNPIIGENSFRQSLKTFLFATYWCIQRIRGFTSMRYINRLFTYLLTV